jgi:uncharacterized membrane protein
MSKIIRIFLKKIFTEKYQFMCTFFVKSILSMVLQNYKKIIEMTANMIYTVALGVGLKCPRKVHLNTQLPKLVMDSSKKLNVT